MALNELPRRQNKKNIAIIVGARPNFIKAVPLLREAKKHPEFHISLIHSGQHFDEKMSKIFFDEMEIPKPDISLNIQGDSHTERLGKMINTFKLVFGKNRFDAAIVFGDVNTTLAGGVSAVAASCSLIHIEAGLRSHDRRMPEEINRTVVDHISDLLFTTEPAANENLIKENIAEAKIKYVGNLIIESIEIFWEKIKSSSILDELGLNKKKYAITTIHRQENTDNIHNLRQILLLLQNINKEIPLVFPLHPGTKKMISGYGLEDLLKNLYVIEPLGYLEFMKLVLESKGVVTDSGGIQEETTHLGIPCCTLRDTTERPITITLGSNKLFSLEVANAKAIGEHLNRGDFKARNIPLWDDQVSKRIFNVLSLEYFNDGKRYEI